MGKGNGEILRVKGLKTYFPVRRGVFSRIRGWVRAVDGVDLEIPRGQTVGLVGESGCGKTTLGRTVLRLIPATAGEVWFREASFGEDEAVFKAKRKRMRQLRRQMQIIFQDPIGSLNPRMTVETIVGEPLKVHGLARGRVLREKVANLLERVGLSGRFLNRYPHEFSGGQRQRIGIARALALEPKLIVCDEPVSALDVSIQSQILNLLADLQDQLGLSYLFIAHNLAVIEHFCDEVAVMYLGQIVERAEAVELYRNPGHPYTRALLSAVPVPDPRVKKVREVPGGDVPDAASLPSGCPFEPRCPLADEHCREERPVLREIGPRHFVACWHSKKG